MRRSLGSCRESRREPVFFGDALTLTVFAGDPDNIKLTRPGDLVRLTEILS